MLLRGLGVWRGGLVERRWENFLMLFVLLPVAGVTWWALHELELQTRRELGSTLETVLTTTQGSLRAWVLEQKAVASLWADSDDVQNVVGDLLGAGPDGARRYRAEAYLRQHLAPVAKGHGYLGFAMISREGVQIAASIDEEMGKSDLVKLDPKTVLAALAGEVALGLPFREPHPWPQDGKMRKPGSPEMIAAAPVHGDGGVRAVLAFVMDPLADFSRVVQLGRTGWTGETYAFDEQGRMITESRFEADLREAGLVPPGELTILSMEVRDPGGDLTRGYVATEPRRTQPLTRMARSAIEGNSGIDLEGYRDYRGVPVVGSWLWDSRLGFGLATEIDVAEAYRSLRSTRWLVLFMLSVTGAGAFLVTGILWRRTGELSQSYRREHAAAAEARQAVAARAHLLAVVSHDLRNPLGAVRMTAQHLLRTPPEEGKGGEARKQLERIGRSAERMARLIQDLLDVSSLESGRLPMRPAPQEVVALVKEAADMLQPLAAERSLALECRISEGAGAVQADRERVLQIFSNLVGNAIKFMPPGGTITIHAQRADSQVRFAVSDTGAGISPEQLPHLFDPYWQDRRTARLGTGLGLSIARGIVEAHGGRIWAESTVGVGSTFYFTLPVA